MNNRQSSLWAAIGRGLVSIGLLLGALAAVIGVAMAARPSSIPRFGGEHDLEARRRDVEYERQRGGIEPVERHDYAPEAVAPYNLMFRWSSVWTGVISGFAILAVLGALVASVGFGTGLGGTSAIVWTIIVAFLGFFGGGWLAGATSPLRGRTEGWVLGSMIWALAAAFLLLFAVAGLAGSLGSITAGITASVGSNTQALAIGTLILLIVTYIGSVIGALVGTGPRREVEVRRPE